MNNIPIKAKKRIDRTNTTLKLYETNFLEYMFENCNRRNIFSLGEEVYLGQRKCIICGWNGSCNYDVYFFDKKEIRNVHPNDLKKEAYII